MRYAAPKPEPQLVRVQLVPLVVLHPPGRCIIQVRIPALCLAHYGSEAGSGCWCGDGHAAPRRTLRRSVNQLGADCALVHD
jgi:hypothetical protein